jgi:HlyD family secretion protein
MKKFLVIILVLAVVVVGYFFLSGRKEEVETSKYEYAQIERGDIQNFVSCTGTLETVGSVDVGTQLSGKIEEILVDYNQMVKENQVLAILDTTQLHLDVVSAFADVERNQASVELSKFKFENDKDLYEQNIISELEFETSKSDYLSKKASLATSVVKLDKAKISLNNYAFIRSPINGQIIDKAVEEGQTVASSMSAPTLFVIAEDISKMEIYADIDETDIGSIEVGQTASFTVETYPEDEFQATISEIRLQPKTVSNVVNYTVVLQVSDTKNMLLPGMTTTLEIKVEEKQDVLMIDNKAFSVKLDQATMMEIMQRKKAEFESKKKEDKGDSSRGQGRGMGRGMMGGSAGGNREMPKDMKMLHFEKDGNIECMPVRIGATDGYKTEVKNPRIQEGMQIITKINIAKGASKSSSKMPRRMGPPGLF